MVFIFLGCFLNALLLLLLLLAVIMTIEWVCFHIFGFVSPLHLNCLELDDTNTKQAWHPGEAFTETQISVYLQVQPCECDGVADDTTGPSNKKCLKWNI